MSAERIGPLLWAVTRDGTTREVAVREGQDTAEDAEAIVDDLLAAPTDAQLLDQARSTALARLRGIITSHETAMLAPYSAGEVASWPELVSAVAAYDADGDSADAGALAMMDARCSVTGETRAALAQTVAARRAAFRMEAARISGWRTKTETAISDATTVAEVATAIAALKAGLAGD